MADLTADPPFVNHVEDVGERLVDANWSPSRYEYAVVELPATLAAAGAARDWATAVPVTSSLKNAERGDVMLVISELVTNAVRHANGGQGHDTVSVAVGIATARLRIEVCDTGAGFSVDGVDRCASDEPGGRGLLIVDAIAQRWGASRDGRHCVWLEIKR
jgi:anti-sigma regulatory factor (Ser/Thr protein kinase)